MSKLPSLSGPVNLKRAGADIIPFHPDLAGHVHKAQQEELKRRRAQSKTYPHKYYQDVNKELVSFLNQSMRSAVDFKNNCGITERLQRNLDLLEGRYSAREIQLMGGHETAVWFNLTERTVRTFVAFLRKTLAGVEVDFPQYNLAPTRVPDPPPEMLERAERAVIDFIELTLQSGQEINEDEIRDILEALSDTLYENVKADLQKSLRRAKREVDDILQKMNWAKIVDDLIEDLVLHGTAIIYGPFPEIRKRQYYDKEDIKVRHERCMNAKRIDPFRFYPSSDSTNTQDGSSVIYHDSMTKQQLIEARSFKNGWIDEAICTVLEEYDTKTRYWCAGYFFQTEEVANHSLDNIGGLNFSKTTSLASNTSTWGVTEEIDVLKFYGKVPAKLLLEHGIDNFDGKKIDEKENLEVEIFWIGDIIIRVNCNIDPLCERPFQRVQLFSSPGRFWGRGAAQTTEPQQRMANSFLRAIVRNTGYTSAPIFEYDKALVRPQGENKQHANPIFPGAILEKNSQVTGLSGQALHTHQIDSRIAEYMNGINMQVELAEQILGIPRFLTGAHSGGGAARTFSGLQQLTENAAVQIRSSIINLDFDLIKPFIARVHRWMILDRKDPLLYSDVEVITQGASALLAREVNKDRLTGLVGLLMPFAQADIVTPNGITYLLAEVIRDHGLDPDLILRDDLELSRFADIFNRNLAGAPGFNGGVAAASGPGGTIAQAGGGAAVLDPISALAAQQQLPPGVGAVGAQQGGIQLPAGVGPGGANLLAA